MSKLFARNLNDGGPSTSGGP